MYKHILIPTDGSALSRSAAVAGIKLAKALGAKVTAVYAAPPATPLVYKNLLPVNYLTPGQHAAAIRKAAASYLGVVEKAAKAAGVQCKLIHTTSDFPADVILATAAKQKCDLIFIASHGRRGLARALLGSQTQKVLNQAKIAVLVSR
jgi:nucleotide-binding universal stress UspA family protein